jgi:hypothetical protein
MASSYERGAAGGDALRGARVRDRLAVIAHPCPTYSYFVIVPPNIRAYLSASSALPALLPLAEFTIP